MLLLLLLAAPAAADPLPWPDLATPALTQDLRIPDVLVVTVSPTPTIRGMVQFPQYDIRIDWEYVRKHPEMWPEWMCDKHQRSGGDE